MLTALVVIAVLGILFGTAALATYEGNVLTDALPDDRDARLPDSALQPEDVGELRFDMAVRGYRMAEVDAVLVRLAAELAARDARVAQLERALAEGLEPLVSAAERAASPEPPSVETSPETELHDLVPSYLEAPADEPSLPTAVDDSAFALAVEPAVEPVVEPVVEPAMDPVVEPAASIEVIPDPPLELPENAASAPAAISGPLTGTTWWDEAAPETPSEPAEPEPLVPEVSEVSEVSAPSLTVEEPQPALDAFAFPELHPPEPEPAAAADPPAPEPVVSEADRWWADAQAAEPPYRS